MICFPAQAQAPKTKAALQAEVGLLFADNTTGAITPLVLRNVVNDFINSWQQAGQVNPQTGTTYTPVVDDYGKLITLANSGAVTVSLPQATGSFATWNAMFRNLGPGQVTLTPTVSTINNVASLVLNTGDSAIVISDGTNYQLGVASIVGKNAINIGAPVNAATTSLTRVMAGFGGTGGCFLTPVLSGRIRATITYQLQNSVASDGVGTIMAFGTGTAPVAGAAPTGTVIGVVKNISNVQSVTASYPASVASIVNNLVLGTSVWFDLQINAVTGGTASVVNVGCDMFEL